MKFDDEICKGVSCPECSFNKWEDGCLLAKRLDEIEIIPEPCEDAISRQAAIDALSQYPFEKVVNCISIIEELPSAQPEQQWIPCSEGLPEDEYVLISKKPSKISGSKWCVTIAIRAADPRSKKVQWRDIAFGVIPDDKILAWMPLPEPYRGE